MARIEESVEINSPVDKVFVYTTQAESWPKWQSFITAAEQTSQWDVDVGTTFKGTNKMMGLSLKWDAKATEYELNRKWAKNITCGSMTVKEHVTYDPIEEGTKFTILYDMKVGGFLKLFSPIVVSSMCKETKKSLSNLKNILEAQT